MTYPLRPGYIREDRGRGRNDLCPPEPCGLIGRQSMNTPCQIVKQRDETEPLESSVASRSARNTEGAQRPDDVFSVVNSQRRLREDWALTWSLRMER